jgi:hypothetical protein
MSGPLDFTNENIENTYQRVLQTDGTDIYDGTGSLFTVTAVVAPAGPNQSVQFNDAGTTSGSGNFTFNKGTNTVNITGSIIASSGFTGSLLGTAATASNTPNAVVTASVASNIITFTKGDGSTFPLTINTGSGGGGGNGNTTTGSYGSFYSTVTQTNPVGNVPRSMSFNITDISNGVLISGSTNPFNTYIKVQNAGVYDIQFSAQLDKTDSGTDEILIWLRKNGIDITDTATTISLVGNNAKNVAAWNFFVNAAANDYYQLIWYSPDVDLRLLAEVSGGGHPGIPSVILTVNRVDQFLSNTGSFSGSFTGNLIGTASYATSASYAFNASTADYATSANYANAANVANYASSAGGVSTYSSATVDQINVGEASTDSYNYIIRAQELEQSKHTTINIFNYLNF